MESTSYVIGRVLRQAGSGRGCGVGACLLLALSLQMGAICWVSEVGLLIVLISLRGAVLL